MDLSTLVYKLRFIEKIKSRASHHSTAEVYVEKLRQIVGVQSLSQPVFESFVLNSLFLLHRHYPWLNSKFYKTLLEEYFSENFGLSEDIASEVLQAFKSIPPNNRENDSGLHNLDYEFLRYLFTEAFTAIDEKDLELELGFGDLVLRYLKNAAANISKTKSETDTPTYLPEMESECVKAMLDLSKDLKANPNVVDTERLYYHVLNFQPIWFVWNKSTAQKLFKYLTKLGEDMVHTTEELNEHLKDVELPHLDHDCLAALELIQPVGFKKRNVAYSLSAYGWQLTADAVAMNVDTNIEFLSEKFLQLNHYYQISVLKRLARKRTLDIVILLEQVPSKLSPQAINPALKTIKPYIQQAELRRIFRNLLDESQPNTIRTLSRNMMKTSDYSAIATALENEQASEM